MSKMMKNVLRLTAVAALAAAPALADDAMGKKDVPGTMDKGTPGRT